MGIVECFHWLMQNSQILYKLTSNTKHVIKEFSILKSKIRGLISFGFNVGSHIYNNYGGARGVMVIVIGNGHGDTSSNPGRD